MGKIKIVIICAESIVGVILNAISDPPVWVSVVLVLGFIVIALITWFWPISFKNPFCSRYISLRDAALKYRDQCLKQGNTAIEVLADTELLGSDLSMQYYAEHILGDYTVWGRRKNTKIWEEISKDERKIHPRITITENGTSLMRNNSVMYPEARMLKYDLKNRLKELNEYERQTRRKEA